MKERKREREREFEREKGWHQRREAEKTSLLFTLKSKRRSEAG